MGLVHFVSLTETHADNLIEADSQSISSAKLHNQVEFEGEVNMLIQSFQMQTTVAPIGGVASGHSKLWFPNPETCNDFPNFTPLQRTNCDQVFNFRTLEKKGFERFYLNLCP